MEDFMIDVLKDLIKKKEIQKYLGIKSEEELLNKIKYYSDKQITDLIFKLIDIEVAIEDTNLINDRVVKPSGHIQLTKDCLYIFNLLESKVNVYDFNDLKKITSYSHIKDPRHIYFSSDNKYFVITGDYTGKIAIYNNEKLEHMKSYSIFKGDNNYLSNSLFTPDNKFIVTADHNGNIYLIDIIKEQVNLLYHFDYVMCFIYKIEYIPDTKEFFFISYRKIDEYSRCDFIFRWKYPFDENNPQESVSILTHLNMQVSYNSKFKHIIFQDIGYKIKGDLIILDDTLQNIINTLRLTENTSIILMYHWSNDGEFLIVSYENNVKIYDYPNLKIIVDLKIANVNDAYFSHDDKYVLINSKNGSYIKEFMELNKNSLVDSKLEKEAIISEESTEENIIELIGNKIEQIHKANPNTEIPDELRIFESLQRFVFLIEEGGIYELFLCSSPYEIKEFEKSLSLIGAKETLKVIQRAIRLYEEERGVLLKQDMRFLIELNKNLVKLEHWDKINDEYYMTNESLDELCYKYYQDNVYKIKNFIN